MDWGILLTEMNRFWVMSNLFSFDIRPAESSPVLPGVLASCCFCPRPAEDKAALLKILAPCLAGK